MTPASQRAKHEPAPDQRKLSALQAQRLAAMSDVDAKELVGLTVADISDKYRFRIDPQLLFFRKVCGRVVKTDPVTGVDYPVPFATVNVEDTDCSLLGYFPTGSKWSWYFPFRCHREVIATAKTDACGNFCVWIPRWDIDWILRWRQQRYCFPIAFERPSLRDILDDLRPVPKWPPVGPGPVELPQITSGLEIRQLEHQLGRTTVDRLLRLSTGARFGELNTDLVDALDSPALSQRIAPPLPKEFRAHPRPVETTGKAMREHHELIRDTLASHTQLDPSALDGVDLRRYIGPFKRCFDVFVPVWQPIIDVPDITFRVNQDTNGDGVEETIYSEGYFQVRWNAGAIGPITLHANQTAVAGQLECQHQGVPCGDEPAIVLAGVMPVNGDATLYDSGNGYVLRANRPHTGGGLAPDAVPGPASTPFYGNVSLFGCIRTNPQATRYRLAYKYSDDDGATFTSYQPVTGREWWLYRLNAGTGLGEYRNITPDSDGWYPINIAGDSNANPFLPRDKVLDWPSNYYANGRYVMKIELGDNVGNVLQGSDEIAFNIDNSAPSAALSVEWKRVGQSDAAFQLLAGACPVVRRGSVPQDLEFRVTMAVAARHLRSAELTAGDCGGGAFVPQMVGTTFHWHQNAADNTETLQERYRLSAGALQGTYSFGGVVIGRAMSPTGYDNAHLLPTPFEYDPTDVHINPHFPFSVIDAD